MRKFFIGLVGLAILFFAFCSTPPPPPAPKPLRIGLSIFPGYAHSFIADDKGFFTANGVEVQLVLEKDYVAVKKLFENGDLDGAFLVYPDAIMLLEKGVDLKGVYVSDYSTTADVLIGKADIASCTALKGKTIAFAGHNTFSHIFVLEMLQKCGIQESEVHFAIEKPFNVVRAMEDGKIDAGHTWGQFVPRALAKGYKVIGRADDLPVGLISDILVFHEAVIKKRPQDVERVIKALFEALDFMKLHREEAIEIMARHDDTTVSEIESTLQGMYRPGIQENIRLLSLREEGSLKKIGETIMRFYLKRGQLSGIERKELKDILDPQFVEGVAMHKGGS